MFGIRHADSSTSRSGGRISDGITSIFLNQKIMGRSVRTASITRSLEALWWIVSSWGGIWRESLSSEEKSCWSYLSETFAHNEELFRQSGNQRMYRTETCCRTHTSSSGYVE